MKVNSKLAILVIKLWCACQQRYVARVVPRVLPALSISRDFVFYHTPDTDEVYT
jgi:hypothetical protein